MILIKNGIKIKNGSGIVKYNVKLSKGKININSKELKIFDLAKEIVDILSTMSQEELKCLKLEYDIALKSVELKELKNRLGGK